MHRGYIKIWRKIKDSGLYQMPETFALFMHLLTEATHQSRRIGTVKLERGQYVAGRIQLAAELQQTERKIRTGIERLQELEIVSVETTSRYSIYTIVNYSNYQDNDQPATSQRPASDQPATSQRPASDQPATTKQTHNTKHKEQNTKNKPKSKDLSAPSAPTAKKGTALSESWFLPKEWGEWALSEKPAWNADDVRRVAADFKDHWLSNANQAKSKKADWLATWRKWVRSPLNEIKPPSKGFSGVQDARLEVARQIMGGLQNGNDRQTIDITPRCQTESNGARIPETFDGFRESAYVEVAGD